MKQVSRLMPVAVVFAGIPLVQAQSVTWSESPGAAPPARCCLGLAFDLTDRSTLMFGGSGPGTDSLNDTWIWQTRWLQLHPVNSPPPRIGPAMVWDKATGNVVLFGGINDNGVFLNDTWIWDGKNWTQQFPPVSPSARGFYCQTMAYDPVSHSVVIFGGLTTGNAYLGDTWTWSGITKTWTQHFPVFNPSPRRAAMAYDYRGKNVILFGGDNNAAHYNDTWAWDGLNWTQLFPSSSPSPRGLQAMAWDANLGVLVLFGGGSQFNALNDTWVWKNGNWTEVFPQGNIPPPRWAAGITEDPISKGLVLFGGLDFSLSYGDTWTLR